MGITRATQTILFNFILLSLIAISFSASPVMALSGGGNPETGFDSGDKGGDDDGDRGGPGSVGTGTGDIDTPVFPNDQDADGVADDDDNCPSTHNPGQDDSDGDGVGNACDNCPTTPNAGQADSDEDGIGNKCDDLTSGPGIGQPGNGGPIGDDDEDDDATGDDDDDDATGDDDDDASGDDDDDDDADDSNGNTDPVDPIDNPNTPADLATNLTLEFLAHFRELIDARDTKPECRDRKGALKDLLRELKATMALDQELKSNFRKLYKFLKRQTKKLGRACRNGKKAERAYNKIAMRIVAAFAG